MRPRVVLYTHSAVLAPALSLAHALSQRSECHLLLELGPATWRMELLDQAPDGVGPGIVPAEPVIGPAFPAAVRAQWRDLASFRLVVHHTARAVQPASWRLSRQVVRAVRQLQPDVVHFDDVSRRMVPALPGLHGLPVVLSLHDPAFHSGETTWRGDLFRRLLLRRATRVVLHNRQHVPSFCARYGIPAERVAVVHLGSYRIARLWAERSCQAPPADRPTVLFFGRLSPYKGLDVLLQAAPHVAARVPGVRFVVAGQPVPGYRVPALPALPNGACIDLLDQYIPSAQVAALFASASVVACPYVDATQSGVVLTAYAFERPVVATTVGGLPEYVRHDETGLLVPPGDPQALAEALVRVLQDEGLQARLRQGVRLATAGAFNWNRAADETLEVYSRARPEPILRPPHGATG